MTFEYMFIVDYDNNILFEYPQLTKDMKKKAKVAREVCVKNCTNPGTTFKKNIEFGSQAKEQPSKYHVTSKMSEFSIIMGLLCSLPISEMDNGKFLIDIEKLVDALRTFDKKDF